MEPPTTEDMLRQFIKLAEAVTEAQAIWKRTLTYESLVLYRDTCVNLMTYMLTYPQRIMVSFLDEKKEPIYQWQKTQK